jgi:phosphatidate cytidylyltransferase
VGDRPRDEQDPFEDLDQFFAPIEDDDWPEGGGELPPAPEPADAPPPSGDAGDALAGLDEIEIDLPEESDLFAGPEADAPAATTGELSQEAPPPEAPEPAAPAPPGQEWDLETGEMSGEEWDRLRAEALAGEGPEEAEVEVVEVAEPADGEGLSVEDLQTAPAQYADLPAPDEPSGPVLEDPLSGTGAAADEGVFGPEDPGVGSLAGPEESAPQPEPEEAPEEATVEAAAEHFASGMRTPEEVERELLSDLGDEGRPETIRIEPTTPVVTEEPTWEEGAEPVRGPEPEPAAAAAAQGPPGGRNVTAAAVSGILLGAAVIALLAIGSGPFAVLVVAAVLLAQAELYAVMRTRGLQPATLLGLVCGGVMLSGAYLNGEGALLLGPALAMGLTVPWYMALDQSARRHIVANAGATMLGVMYVPFFGSFAMLLLRGGRGEAVFLVVLGMTVLYDVCAYAVGTLWGSRPLAPTISPHKSWEGAIGATFVVLLMGLSIVANVEPFNAGSGVGLALIISVVAPLGDLVESALKRDMGVKDMGSLLPGHGGMLDRIDAILFVVPAAYFLLRIVLG